MGKGEPLPPKALTATNPPIAKTCFFLVAFYIIYQWYGAVVYSLPSDLLRTSPNTCTRKTHTRINTDTRAINADAFFADRNSSYTDQFCRYLKLASRPSFARALTPPMHAKEDLCKEQRHVLDLVLRGKSVFFTGAAGTGKTFLLKRLHKVRYSTTVSTTLFLVY